MINPMELGGRTVLVTGASSGIGREIAVLLSQLGARVVLAGRNEERLKETTGMMEGSGHREEPFDLSDVDAIPGWMKKIASGTGPLHGIVHSAGLQITKPLRMITRDSFEEKMRLNAGAAVGLTKGFRQRGVCAPGGSLVYITSVMGVVGMPGQVEYACTKGALVALTKSAAVELAREGIRVNCIAPALVETPMGKKFNESLSQEQLDAVMKMHPLGLGLPRDVAYAAAFLIADTARWITGTTMIVDGGYTAL